MLSPSVTQRLEPSLSQAARGSDEDAERSLRWEKATALLREEGSHAGLPWRPGGHDSALPSQGEWDRSPVEELRSRKLHRVARDRARWRPLRIGRKQGLRVGGAREARSELERQVRLFHG